MEQQYTPYRGYQVSQELLRRTLVTLRGHADSLWFYLRAAREGNNDGQLTDQELEAAVSRLEILQTEFDALTRDLKLSR